MTELLTSPRHEECCGRIDAGFVKQEEENRNKAERRQEDRQKLELIAELECIPSLLLTCVTLQNETGLH